MRQTIPFSTFARAAFSSLLVVFGLGCFQSAPVAESAAPSQPAASPEFLSASSWPMFRGGPDLLGVAPGRLGESFELLWTFKTGDAVKSSPAIVNGRVFIGSDDGRVYAISLETGEKVWSFETEGPVESSPLVLDGRVFAGSADEHLYALEAETGKLIWKFKTEDRILGSPNWVQSPDGQANWILIGSYDYKLYAVEAAEGELVWSYETDNYVHGTPAVADGRTMFGGCDALVHVISLADGTKVEEVEAGAHITGSGAAANNRFYIGHYGNEFICVDIGKGEVAWTYRDRSFPYFSSPAISEDRVVFGGRDRQLHAVRRSDGEPIWTFATRGRVDSSPVICDGKVVVGSQDGRLYVVSLADGTEVWNFEIGEAISGSPAVVDGKIVIGSEDGNVYAFGSQ